MKWTNYQINEVLSVVANETGISMAQIVSDERNKSVILARHIAAKILHDHFGMTMVNVAKTLGRKDHSTIVHAIQKIDDHLTSRTGKHAEVRLLYNQIFALLKYKGFPMESHVVTRYSIEEFKKLWYKYTADHGPITEFAKFEEWIISAERETKINKILA